MFIQEHFYPYDMGFVFYVICQYLSRPSTFTMHSGRSVKCPEYNIIVELRTTIYCYLVVTDNLNNNIKS